MFLPTTRAEMKKLGWDFLDVIIITGDSYIDSPYIGASVIGRLLQKQGYKVGIIAQPDINSDKDITRLGEPRLFWGVSGGSVDSMVANYTASKKKRKSDDYTPGGVNNKRPDRAVIAYSNLIRRFFKNTAPIVLGGIEASLRRITHYDFWSDSLRKPILFDAKADILLYGMAQRSIVELADALHHGRDYKELRGVCYISKDSNDSYLQIPNFEMCLNDKFAFIEAFEIFYKNNDPHTAKGLCQKVDTRYYIQNPPSPTPTSQELDEVAELPYMRDLHPYYKAQGEVKALETIRFSITTHQGCYGECNFCAIALHQGRTVASRSEESILKEATSFTKDAAFKGYIEDVGGASANMYGIDCDKMVKKGVCSEKRCLHPKLCKSLKNSHKRQIDLLKKIREIPKVKKAFVRSGIRYDLILEDTRYGEIYLEELLRHHISGQMKIAPEHTDQKVLESMGKPDKQKLLAFKKLYESTNKKLGKKQFLTYYFIAAHPSCSQKDMEMLGRFCKEELRFTPEQIQIFTPTPSTYSTLMYYTGFDPFTKKPIFVEKDGQKKERQKDFLRTR